MWLCGVQKGCGYVEYIRGTKRVDMQKLNDEGHFDR